jgi:hypothetical protein
MVGRRYSLFRIYNSISKCSAKIAITNKSHPIVIAGLRPLHKVLLGREFLGFSCICKTVLMASIEIHINTDNALWQVGGIGVKISIMNRLLLIDDNFCKA